MFLKFIDEDEAGKFAGRINNNDLVVRAVADATAHGETNFSYPCPFQNTILAQRLKVRD